MRPQSCTVSEPLALVLRIMRVLSLAPLTIARERTGYRIRVCKRYAYVGYFCIIFLNVFHGVLIFVDMAINSDYYSALRAHIPLLSFLVQSNILVVALITLQGSLFSVSRMNKLIEHVIYMEKAIPTNTKEVSNKNKRLLIFMIISRVFIDTANFIRIFYIRELPKYKIYNYILSRIKYLLVCSMQMYVFIIYEEILFKIRVVREELQDLANFLEFEYVPSPGFTRSANTKLQKIGEKLDCIRKIFTRMNQCNEYAVFFLYICIVSRLIEMAFEFVSFLQKPSPVNTITYLFIITYYIFLPIILIEPFRGIELEMQAMKFQVGRIATTDYVTDSIPAPLEMLYDELSAIDLSFSPLGVFTINRSLLAKTFGAAISYLTIIFQFRS